jgi:phosphomannomutase
VNPEAARALYDRAQSWSHADPDPITRAELAALIASRAELELHERMGPELDFGTAGLRGVVGAGPARMNRAVVVRATRALALVLLEQGSLVARPVVVGYDARPSSRSLAEAAAGVLVAAGFEVRWFEEPTPTPLVAYAARVLGACAALVLTASHNPRADNGLKVYGPDACQLGAPFDHEVMRRRESVGPAAGIPRLDLAELRQRPQSFRPLGAELLERYLAELAAALPPSTSAAPNLRIAYTPIHGVGLRLCREALAHRGFRDFHAVAEQAEPDGTFPTTEFPNPEHPGTLDLALALAAKTDAHLMLANDPDADRLAAGARTEDGALRVLSGNEVAALLADFVLEVAPVSPRPLLVTSIVTSPLVLRIAAAHGARGELTLTGFKWIWRAARELTANENLRFAFGCEEALGYSIGELVRDKDGIAAAVWLAELAARCRRRGQSLTDRLGEIHRQHGAWSSAQRSLVRAGRAGVEEISAMLTRLSSAPPRELDGLAREKFMDYRGGAEQRAAWLGSAALFELELAGGARVLVRPSGTEPKLKIYADAVELVAAGEKPELARRRAFHRAERLATAMAHYLGDD